MNHRRIFTAVVAMALVLAACGGEATSPSASGGEPSASEGAGQPGGTLVFGGARLSSSLDPALTSDGESFRVLRQVYETLVDLAPGSTNELIG
ncbi:MAG TPA: ABC transporter substrate-binding protein, partial [Candidatus Limnocylindria bacterium]|nr:ABC transporter substrate-binding protein [Candidatus Limnocylindria bacterium]